MPEERLRKTASLPEWKRVGSIVSAAALFAAFALVAPMSQAASKEERMKVRGVVPDLRTRMPVLVLEDSKSGRKVLRLWIGVPEANAILLALERVAVPRPMTHDLLRNLLKNLKARVLRVTITALRGNTFVATIYLRSGKETLQVDSRPSAAVALALRADAPIFVSTQVLARAGQIRPPAQSLTSEVRAYGLTVQEITADLLPHFRGAQAGAILITDVKAGSPGAREGLKRGDVVLHINNLQVRGLKNFLSLLQSADSRKEPVRLSVNRGDERLQLTLSDKKRTD